MLPKIDVSLPAVGSLIPAIEYHQPAVSFCPKWVDLGEYELLDMVIPAELVFLPLLMAVIGFVFVL
jgi:hypothetical protein